MNVMENFFMRRGWMLGVLVLFWAAGCDTDAADGPSLAPTADLKAAVITGPAGDSRSERVFVVPAVVSAEAKAAGEALAAASKCDTRAMVLPPETRIRIVEEGGVRRVFFRTRLGSGEAGDRAENASVAGDPGKGDGRVNANDAPRRAPSMAGFSEETEIRCRCARPNIQNQTTGCTPAVNPNSGHVYCDAYGACNECRMTIVTDTEIG